jgi:outer membrane protein TolC
MPTTTDAQQQIFKQLTMNDAVQRALKHRPDLKAWHYTIQALKSYAQSEKAGYLPTVDLESSVSQSNGEQNLDSSHRITARQVIYKFDGPIQKYRQAKNIAHVSELERIIQANLTRRETEKDFLNAWLVQEKEKSITALKTSTQTTFARQQHRNKLEKLDRNVWLKNIADYATNLALVDQYEEDVLIAYKKLEFLMGESLDLLSSYSNKKELRQPHTKLLWNYKKKYELKPLETYYRNAIEFRPEITQGSKKIAIENWNIKLAQGARLPSIIASANVGCNTNPNNSLSAIKPFWRLNVSLNMSIFDGLVHQHREQQAESNKLKELLKRDQEILNIKQQVHEKNSLLVSTLKQLNEQKLKHLHGYNHFELMKQKLELGRIAPVDFDEAKTVWQKVQFDWLSYNIRLALMESDLMWACGYPSGLPSNFI